MLTLRWKFFPLLAFLMFAVALAQAERADAQGTSLNSYEQQVVNLINQQRTQRGLKPLQVDGRLVQAARDHNAAMIRTGTFAHQVAGERPLCASGSNNDRYEAVRYYWRACAENIAAGYTTPEAVVNGWMNSSGHRANILNANYVHVGVGYTTGGRYGRYWTLDFGKSQ